MKILETFFIIAAVLLLVFQWQYFSAILIKNFLSIFPSSENVWLIYFVLIFFTLFIWALPALIKKIASKSKFAWGRLAHSLFIGFFVLLSFSLYFPLNVKKQAEIDAKGNPYCIEVAYDGDYRPAKTWLDFTPLGMFAMGYEYHALLIVVKENMQYIYHWSYLKNQFDGGDSVEVASSKFPLQCNLDDDFIGKLPIIFPKKTNGDLEVMIEGKHWLIPAAYSPIVSSDTRSISILAEPITFAPLNKARENLSWEEQIAHKVRIDLKHGGIDGCWNTQRDYLQYCVYDGKSYSFGFGKEKVENWETVQNNLIELIKSFENSGLDVNNRHK